MTLNFFKQFKNFRIISYDVILRLEIFHVERAQRFFVPVAKTRRLFAKFRIDSILDKRPECSVFCVVHLTRTRLALPIASLILFFGWFVKILYH